VRGDATHRLAVEHRSALAVGRSALAVGRSALAAARNDERGAMPRR